MALQAIHLLIGLLILIKGADFLVKGASSLARRSGVSEIMIGLTIVALGTSLPELVLSVFSSFQGRNDLLLGNIIGSNISNILLILGASALVAPLLIKRDTAIKEIPFIIAITMIVGLMVFIPDANRLTLGPARGAILLLLFLIFVYYTIVVTSRKEDVMPLDSRRYQPAFVWSMLLLGVAGLILGAEWVVDGAVFFAQAWGVSQSLIGLTIVAIGTSLPELATSLVAAYRRNQDLAVGNIIGSNIFNITLILGLSAIIHPVVFSLPLIFDLVISLGAIVMLLLCLLAGDRKEHILKRWQGALMLVLYLVYIVFTLSIG